MACMNNQARNATIRAKGPASVLVIRRNMLHMLRRNKAFSRNPRSRLCPACPGKLDGRRHTLPGFPVERTARACRVPERSRPKEDVKFVRVDPMQIFIRQGDRVESVYFLRAGHVEVSEVTPSGDKQVRDYMGPGRSFGEIAIMSELSAAVANQVHGNSRRPPHGHLHGTRPRRADPRLQGSDGGNARFRPFPVPPRRARAPLPGAARQKPRHPSGAHRTTSATNSPGWVSTRDRISS